MAMIVGQVVVGVGHFRGRIMRFADVFERATGEKLFAGTLNVRVDRPIPIREDFRILGADIDEPEQDLLFEHCRVNGINAYRIRPLHLATGGGGHGDHVLEIASAERIPNVPEGAKVSIEFNRELD